MTATPIIYHGTPMTPRAALQEVCTGRAMCVSFYRPDDVEVVEAISPAIMFRQRSLFVLAGGSAQGGRYPVVLRWQRLGGLLPLAGAATVPSGPLGRDTRQPRSAKPAQRRIAERLAFRSQGRAGLAHGRPAGTAAEAVRAVSARLPGLDRAEGRRAVLPCAHGGSLASARQSLALPAHAPRNGGRLRLSLRQRRQHVAGAERVAL